MTTPDSPQAALSRRALRFADGADRPVLVEELYVDWDVQVNHGLSFQSTRSRVAAWWPTQGVAWEKFGDVISEHVDAGRLVICKNTDPAEDPEYHITQGHHYPRTSSPFQFGERPMVLRYITTPAGSIAWKRVLTARAADAERQAQRETAAREQRAAQVIVVTNRVLSAVRGGAATITAMAAATGFSKDDVQAAVHRLVADGRIVYDGRRLWGGHRWLPTEVINT
ncbi:hypothetical protein [Micromonospora sp. WMMD980]|uniref:hypothetical protein n=1 Tax=Micromonospora sp. WMMD980 TaxID=3016088 RepID=UPI002416343B|nr:hypothetical protein [Micromonospora sp. WMMD980]MDG4803710.1 hypothetical protein [Micromonospora sp. WMMD980]